MDYAIERRAVERVAALSRRKEDLETLIREELKRRIPCSFTLQRLKKMKLSVKDRIAELNRLIGKTAKARQRSRTAAGMVRA